MDKLSILKWDKNIKIMPVNKELHNFINRNQTNKERVYLKGTQHGKYVFAYADRVSYKRLAVGLLFLLCLAIPIAFLVFILFMFKQREEIKHGLPKEYMDGLQDMYNCLTNKRIYHIYESVSHADELVVLNAHVNKDSDLELITKEFVKKYTKVDDEC